MQNAVSMGGGRVAANVPKAPSKSCWPFARRSQPQQQPQPKEKTVTQPQPAQETNSDGSTRQLLEEIKQLNANMGRIEARLRQIEKQQEAFKEGIHVRNESQYSSAASGRPSEGLTSCAEKKGSERADLREEIMREVLQKYSSQIEDAGGFVLVCTCVRTYVHIIREQQ
jgi:hypothetical protein